MEFKVCRYSTYNYGIRDWGENRWTCMIVRFLYLLHKVIQY